MYCFLDANTLIHFRTFDEVDWPAVLGAPEVCLVLAPSVMRELDKFKDDHTNDRRRKRVRTLLSKLEERLEQSDEDTLARVCAGVTILDLPYEPRVDWDGLHLDPAIADDRLIASILEFRSAYPDASVLLVSNDFPARRKAKRHGIEARDPEGTIPGHEFPSDEAAKVKKLEQRVRELEARVPNLELQFCEETGRVGRAVRVVEEPTGAGGDWEGRVGWISDAKLREILDNERSELEQLVAEARGKAEESDIADYRYEYELYLERLTEQLVKLRTREHGRRCGPFAFVLRNTGAAPAVDVVVELQFPLESFVVAVEKEHDDYIGLMDLTLPGRPVPEWLKPRDRFSSMLMPSMRHMTAVTRPAREPVPEGPVCDWADRSRVVYKHPKMRPQSDWSMEPVVVYLPLSVEGGFEIHYSIHADGLPGPKEGQLGVTLRKAASELEER